MFCLFEKIKACRMDLINWSKMAFRNTRTRVNEKQQELEELMGVDYGNNLQRITTVKREVNELLHHEEVF